MKAAVDRLMRSRLQLVILRNGLAFLLRIIPVRVVFLQQLSAVDVVLILILRSS